MTKFDIIKFKFEGPLHISNPRPNEYSASEKIIRSDSIMAAIMQAWALLGHADWIPKEENPDAGFAMSSLFPFYEDKEPVYFFPKPYFNYLKQNSASNNEAKKIKKIEFIDQEFFSCALMGEPKDLPANYNGKYLTLKNLPKGRSLMEGDVVPRISKGTQEGDPKIFYMERIYFHEQAGLYCILNAEVEIKSRIKMALDYLEDAGLGTDRNVGNGKFTCKIDSMELNLPTDANFMTNMGLYCPESKAELVSLLDENARYDFIKRGGWLSEPHNTIRKKSVYMFKEGSVFKGDSTIDIMLYGKLVDLRPDNDSLGESKSISHPVWRNGKTIFVPVKIN